MIFWFFGYPGIGKDFWAEKLSKLVSIPHLNADDFLTPTDRRKILNSTFTQHNRIKKLKRIISHIKKGLPKSPHIIATDSLPDNMSRKLLFDTFAPNIIFIHVTAPKQTHLNRLTARKDHFFTEKLLKVWIKKHWEKVNIPHLPFRNSQEGNEKIEKKLLNIYHAAISTPL